MAGPTKRKRATSPTQKRPRAKRSKHSKCTPKKRKLAIIAVVDKFEEMYNQWEALKEQERFAEATRLKAKCDALQEVITRREELESDESDDEIQTTTDKDIK